MLPELLSFKVFCAYALGRRRSTNSILDVDEEVDKEVDKEVVGEVDAAARWRRRRKISIPPHGSIRWQ